MQYILLHGKGTKMKKQILKEYNSEEKSYLVENYPYGFKLRTKIRYWIEDNKTKGQRFCSQTLNPKTNVWNKPKKSTYAEIIILYLNEKNHVKGYYYTTYGKEDLEKLLNFVKEEDLTEFQKDKLNQSKAILKVYEKVSFEIKARRFLNIETGEITTSVNVMEINKYKEIDDNGKFVNKEEEEKEQKEIKQTINKAINYEYIKLKGVVK